MPDEGWRLRGKALATAVGAATAFMRDGAPVEWLGFGVMEIVERSGERKPHRWLKWAGLEAPPLEADSWVPIVRGLTVSDAATHTSTLGTRLVGLLGDAGIEAQQRSYQYDDSLPMPFGSIGSLETRVAVLVHNSDVARATEIAAQLNETLDEETNERRVSDEELTRQALEAPPSPEAQ